MIMSGSLSSRFWLIRLCIHHMSRGNKDYWIIHKRWTRYGRINLAIVKLNMKKCLKDLDCFSLIQRSIIANLLKDENNIDFAIL